MPACNMLHGHGCDISHTGCPAALVGDVFKRQVHILVAKVTGVDHEAGFRIVRRLAPQFRGAVYISARTDAQGIAAANDLRMEGFSNVEFLSLNINYISSMEKASCFIKNKHGGLDVLINNAGMLGDDNPPKEATKSNLQVPENDKTVFIGNFNGVINLSIIMFAILRPHARVVNMSSMLGNLGFFKNPDLKERILASDGLSLAELQQIVADCVTLLQIEYVPPELLENSHPLHGYGSYALSKICVTALTRIQQRMIDQDHPQHDITINCCCPSFPGTNPGVNPVDEVADGAAYLALLPKETADIPRGQLVCNRMVQDWVGNQRTLRALELAGQCRNYGGINDKYSLNVNVPRAVFSPIIPTDSWCFALNFEGVSFLGLL